MTADEYKSEARRLRPKLMSLARRYVGDADEAGDMVQDALLRMWNMHGELRLPMDRFASVLVRNLCIDHLRHSRPSVPLPETDIGDDCPEALEHERVERMMAVVGNLPDMQQMILRLRHIEGMDMAGIAEIIGSNEVAVRKALSRARQAVRNKLMKGASNG